MKIPKKWEFAGQKRHLVSELTDGDTEIVVFKYWLKHKQRWVYSAEERWLIERELDPNSKKLN